MILWKRRASQWRGEKQRPGKARLQVEEVKICLQKGPGLGLIHADLHRHLRGLQEASQCGPGRWAMVGWVYTSEFSGETKHVCVCTEIYLKELAHVTIASDKSEVHGQADSPGTQAGVCYSLELKSLFGETPVFALMPSTHCMRSTPVMEGDHLYSSLVIIDVNHVYRVVFKIYLFMIYFRERERVRVQG